MNVIDTFLTFSCKFSGFYDFIRILEFDISVIEMKSN